MDFLTHYYIASTIFIRLIGVVYFFTFFPFLFQIRGLIGRKGILPAAAYYDFLKKRLGRWGVLKLPSVFWWNASDSMLMGVVAAGIASSLLLAFGFYPPLFLLLLIILHLSIINSGQDFLSFGWEMLFVEICYNAFLLSIAGPANIFVWFSLNFLIFRFYFESGISKIHSRDPTWKNLTALCYHYQTQPIPHALAWYWHKLPAGFQRFSTAAVLFIEIAVPFGVFGNEDMRFIVFVLFFLLQFGIILSGNYSYLNYLTIVMIIPLISGRFLIPLFGPINPPEAPSLWVQAPASIAACLLILLQAVQLAGHYYNFPRLKSWLLKFYSYHFANRFGIFSIMTTVRYEIVIKGSMDGKEWKEYLFYFKPSEVSRRPRLISPFHPRLDWQAWFLPFTNFQHESWFQNFLLKLLQGEPLVLHLLRGNPFPDAPPKYIKADIYVYEFSPASIKKSLGHWWVRTYIGSYSPVLSLKA